MSKNSAFHAVRDLVLMILLCVCVCVCVMASSGLEGYSISVGPVMRLVHPITSPFAASPFKS